MTPPLIIAGIFVACIALVLAHNVVLAWLAARAATEERREVHYHQLVDVSLRAMNTAREEILAAWERNERHLETVLESFLSRTFEERQMGRMIAGEIRVEQETDQTLDIDEDDAAAVELMRTERIRTPAPASNGEVAAGIEELERQARERGAGFERSAVGPETE